GGLCHSGLFLAAEIIVSFVHPVSAWRIEDVEVNCVFHGFGFVRHMRRNREYFTSMNNDFLAIDPEFKGAVENIGDLLVVVAVQRHDTSFFHEDTCDHNLLPYNELTLQQRVQIFERYSGPRNVLEARWTFRSGDSTGQSFGAAGFPRSLLRG